MVETSSAVASRSARSVKFTILGGSGRESPGGMKNLEATESGFENFQKKGVKKRFFFGFFKSEKIADLVETF